ncbi:RagB/SusD family nutrient uptake outer membrane protein [Sphingobacterium sp. 18053]|uniref:RagB/SusD family nutrient uptake outer membrane protein n=1 Tax=Sphingobacterium sp. 18053 TaxID=2681401 RepID=UPI00135CE150|nr:RagB/SusD family nutrient uptake outer membrane protein [Sphingobacterium sp. 18053]
MKGLFFIRFYLSLIIITLIVSCKKFLDVGSPVTETSSKEIFANDNSATAAMLGVYGEFMKTANLSMGASIFLGQSADEFRSYAVAPYSNYYTNNLNAIDNNDFWTAYYGSIYRCNAVLEGVSKSSTISSKVSEQLRGEALFTRAFLHFYLVNIFGDIPYVATTNYKENNLAPRESVESVYNKIIADLQEAKVLLNDIFPDAANKPSTERVRPNRTAAEAMLARVYLYKGEWERSEEFASAVLSKSQDYGLSNDLNDVFKKNSREAIWQMMPSDAVNTNGFEGYTYILLAPPGALGRFTIALNDYLLNAFEIGDKRRNHWVGTYLSFHYPFKYKVGALSQPTSEYSMVIRLAEVVLIRAEARAMQAKLNASISDLDKIRNRAGLALIADIDPMVNKQKLLETIWHERQIELFSEWGHRWFDLKRTGRADSILAAIKGSNWKSTDELFPIPKIQIDYSPVYTNAQNPGYN